MKYTAAVSAVAALCATVALFMSFSTVQYTAAMKYEVDKDNWGVVVRGTDGYQSIVPCSRRMFDSLRDGDRVEIAQVQQPNGCTATRIVGDEGYINMTSTLKLPEVP